VFKINFIRTKIKVKYLKGLNYNIYYCDRMIENKSRVDPSLANNESPWMRLDVETKKLGIPLISDVKELRRNFILFAATLDTDDNTIEVEYLKKLSLLHWKATQKLF